ncbi:hypothetical protein [Arcobacter defluvii]|uniref:VCBS repeat-containing protein n=1 Tax=Arcobacter defluvii TaxID=873191 RepID=A0AAE7BG34_9BACT|nr:hypothetical protein [Arcobacter defluvii]QKF78885.1 hypothetical protein ADFLV_2920 [Arcobacter defluvii]RXI30718.1 hypothetical protein CP964_11565 [Arcobacter defluvii]
MIIKNSQILLSSQSQYAFKHSSSTSVQLHYGEKTQDEKQTNQAFVLNFQQAYASSIQYERVAYNYEDNMSLEDRIKKLIIEKLLERLNNEKKVSLYPNKKIVSNLKENITMPLNPYKDNQKTLELKAMVFQTQENYYQKQSVDFSASVKFQTPNNTYEMNLNISFSKELYEASSSQIIIGDKNFVDPLIINYGEDINPFENISSLRFAFDLDNNGETEMIPYLKNGAGFLALDKNDNGSIDNGSELFGPKTNNGFKELAMYDSDNNNFIDENDMIFNKLKIWSIDESGNSSLISLLDANVGAIYLGDVQSGFSYQNSIESKQAVQKSNGIFIKEDGSGLGVVNSIDIVV